MKDGCIDLDEMLSKIADFEKENAELKNFIMQSKKDGISPINALIIKNLGNQLTKAKEIIKELYEGLDKLYLSGLSAKQIAFIEQLQDKAEQFLNEVEK